MANTACPIFKNDRAGLIILMLAVSYWVSANVLQLQEVGDFEAQNFLPP
jgi:hypothetical protein